jgi:hypothetical protein
MAVGQAIAIRVIASHLERAPNRPFSASKPDRLLSHEVGNVLFASGTPASAAIIAERTDVVPR